MLEDETSLDDLQEVKGDPFRPIDRISDWILRDSLRSIKIGVGLVTGSTF